MQNINKWRHQIFCFRVSVLFILVWLAISSAASLIFYFSFSDSEETNNFIISFSTWIFIIPAVTFFGLINTIPLIIDWVTKPLEQKEAEHERPITKNVHIYTEPVQQTREQKNEQN